jgi:hypothetical protein
MNTLLKEFSEYATSSKKEIQELLKYDLNGMSIINFITLNYVNLYAVCDLERTSLGNLVNTLFDNYDCTYMDDKYHCKQYERSDLVLYSDQLNKKLQFCDDGNMETRLSSYGFDKISGIKIMSEATKMYDKSSHSTTLERMKRITELKKQVKLNEQKTLTIFIKLVSEDIIVLRALPSCLIEDIKLFIAEEENFPIDLQRIVYNGVQLRNDKKLSDYDIDDSSTLHMVPRLRTSTLVETNGKTGNFNTLKSLIFVVPKDLNSKAIDFGGIVKVSSDPKSVEYKGEYSSEFVNFD